MFIGITGRGRSGKDTTAGIVLERLNCKLDEEDEGLGRLGNPRFHSEAFMDPFKEHIGAGVFGLSQEQMYGDLKAVEDPRWGCTPRYILQVVITDMLRARWPNIVHLGPKSPFVRLKEAQHCLITDVRIPGECEVLHSFGGFLIRVERPGLSKDIGGVEGHATEKDVENLPADHVVVNDGTLEDLFAKAAEAADIVWGRYLVWRAS